jgi:hypothetical protein
VATSIRDLLEQLHQRTTRTAGSVDTGHADDALVAAETLGRVLAWLAADGVHPDPNHPRSRYVQDLADVVRHISSHTSTDNKVRLADLAGAAADLAALSRDQFGAAERWSAATAVAEAIQHCIDYARPGTSPHQAPIYQRIHAAAATLAQQAAADPPDPLRRTMLDTSAIPPPGRHGLAGTADAAPRLVAAIRRAQRRGGLTLADGLAAIAAAHTAAHYAQLIAAASQTTETDRHPAEDTEPWRETARAWQQTHRTLNTFDDGTRTRHTASTAIAAAALELHHGLRHHVGADTTPEQLRLRTDLPDLATALRQIANHLPPLAETLAHAVNHWGHTGQLVALATNLPHSGRSLDTYLRRRIVTTDINDLKPTRTALRRAHTLSMHLAGELDRSTKQIGSQPQPHLATSHRLNQATNDAPAAATQVRAVTPRVSPSSRPWHLPPRHPRAR